MKVNSSFGRFCLLSFTGLITFLNFAFATEYFPSNLSKDLEFRAVLETAIAAQSPTFSYTTDGQVHDYYIGYGGDFKAVRDKLFPVRGTDTLADLMRTKGIYKQQYTELPGTRTYSLWIHRPQLPLEVKKSFEYVPYVSGPPLDQISAAGKAIKLARVDNYPKLQGPYFTVTLTDLGEVPQLGPEYRTSFARMKGMRYVKDLIKKYIQERISNSVELQKSRTKLLELMKKKNTLTQGYTQHYRFKAIENAKQDLGKDTLPEGTVGDIRPYLNVSENHELEDLEQEIHSEQEAANLHYTHEVSAYLTTEKLMPYIYLNSDRRTFIQSSLAPIRKLHRTDSSDDEDEDGNEISSEFIIYVLKGIGPIVFEEMHKQLGI